MAAPADDNALSSGVDALIARLRDEGVTAGREEADRLLSEARTQARQIVDKANAEARAHLETARKDADSYRAAGEEALKSAMRDTVLDMKAALTNRFGNDVRRLVSQAMQDEDLLRQMILEIVGRARDGVDPADDASMEVILPQRVAGLEELRANPAELREGRLTRFVLGLTGEMMRRGVTFAAADDLSAGMRVQVKDQDVTLELTDEAVAGLLLQHLQPRFRAILEGIVK